jgi:hypothetical protein
MPGRKGHTNNPKGKTPGTKNKPEAHLIKAFSHAWLLSIGEAGYKEWANDNKTEAMKIAAKFVPQEVTGKDGGPIETVSTVIIGGQK